MDGQDLGCEWMWRLREKRWDPERCGILEGGVCVKVQVELLIYPPIFKERSVFSCMSSNHLTVTFGY